MARMMACVFIYLILHQKNIGEKKKKKTQCNNHDDIVKTVSLIQA